MADQTFPTALPQPTVDYSFSVNPANLRSEDATALGLARQRSGVRLMRMRVAWNFDDSELDTFQTFFDTTIEEGNMPFNIQVPIGDGLKNQEARFFEAKYNADQRGDLDWYVSADLWIQDPEEDDDCATYIGSLMYTNGTVATIVLPLKCGTFESYEAKMKGFHILDLSTGTFENQAYSYESHSELDLSTGTFETGST